MRKQHAVCGGLGQKGRLGDGVGGKGLEGLRRHLETPGWVDLAGQSWPGEGEALRGDPRGITFRSGCCLCPGRAEQPWAGHFSIQGLRFPISKMGTVILPTQEIENFK